jgi:hypothetical protein
VERPFLKVREGTAMQLEIKRREAGAGQAETGKLGALWCNFMHDAPLWPIHGEYQCGICGRHYPVPWTENRAFHAHQGLGA